MRIRVGGDPRGFSEFTALRKELTRLSHPARPDVDWAKVEQLCLTLFEQNGAELLTVASFTLARSQRHGLEGMAQGVALIETLGCEWPRLWPAVTTVRLDILGWLFAQLQPLLRGLALNANSLPSLVQLDTELVRLNQQLESLTQVPLVTLQALRQQVSSLIYLLERNSSSGETVSPVVNVPEPAPTPALVTPVVILPDAPRMPDVISKRSRIALWLLATVITIALVSWFWWSDRPVSPDSEGTHRLTSLARQERLIPDPVRLDRLSPFDAGSAQLKTGSTQWRA
ncbi:type VI secretion system ImpA family N-terminal domain-containing protein [Pseudomonas sp. GGS8]|uniref:type VI secretion system ImpA family N-terminal domain-containing protein n=1 Tax=Pseudomonas sp. GGS8 TaxID=2817892 RepID=UPI00209D6AE5|nr:type VI secretion system ImpA family N-terminal domain-containing protein [Pseudomonas sp. GGS8]